MGEILFLIIAILISIINRKNKKIKILENNWETAKKIIGEYDPDFKAYLER